MIKAIHPLCLKSIHLQNLAKLKSDVNFNIYGEKADDITNKIFGTTLAKREGKLQKLDVTNRLEKRGDGDMISLIIWIVLGFLAGYLAKAIMPGADGGGFILTTILGIVGAVVGGFIGSLVGYPMVSSFDNIGGSIPSFIFSIIGAIVVLAIYRLATGRSIKG